MSGRLVQLITGALLLVAPAAAPAQTDASLGIGFGTVRFRLDTAPPGDSLAPALSVFSVSPILHFVGPGRDLEASGMFAALPSGGGYAQGRLAAWAATAPLVGRWRLAVEARLSGATSGPRSASGAGQLGVEGLLTGPRWGVAVGAGTASGWIVYAAPVTAWRARFRGWSQGKLGNPDFFASIEPTRFQGAWFTDITGTVVLHRGRIETSLSTSARVSRAFGSKAAALAALDVHLAPNVSLEAAGGNVLPDPYQGFPASGFVTVGVRVHLPSHAAAPRALVRSGPLTALRRGTEVVIQFRVRDAHVVAIAGDWNDWTPTPLAQSDHDQWELSIPLAPGPHRFMVFVDGTPWQIPEDVPSVPDGMGDRVAVLNVF